MVHPEWLANPILIEKSNRKWRMCVDYTNLNRACSKDDFPLPRIDATSGCELMSFLEAYSWYHYVWMAKEDEEKTNFITSSGMFCYI